MTDTLAIAELISERDRLRAKVRELEGQLEAVGAGGVQKFPSLTVGEREAFEADEARRELGSLLMSMAIIRELTGTQRCHADDTVAAVRAALAPAAQAEPVAFYVYEWVNQSDGTVFRSFRPDEHHMGRQPDRTIAVPAHPPAQWLTHAASDVLAERRRQVSAEGWTAEHDDEHRDGSLALAAGCYCESAARPVLYGRKGGAAFAIPKLWPHGWNRSWWKPRTPREDLVRAGALILAEIERLDRAA